MPMLLMYYDAKIDIGQPWPSCDKLLLTALLYFDKVAFMKNPKLAIWKSRLPQQLAEVLASIDDEPVMQSFLRDILTEKEIIEISARLEAAKMLRSGIKYTDIVAATGLSSRTVARISDWLKGGTGGYDAVLEVISSHHAHIPPARAD